MQGQSTVSRYLLLRPPAGRQINRSDHIHVHIHVHILVHVLALTLPLTFSLQPIINFLPDALGRREVKLSSGSSSDAELPLGSGHSTALQKNPLSISSFAGRKAPFSLQSREQKGGDERGREREHFRLVIQLQRSESICRASEVCLFLQEQRKKANSGVMGLGLTIHELGREDITQGVCRVLLQIQPCACCIMHPGEVS